MTLKEIAMIAHVSISTVSKALAGSREINIETIVRIQKIAEENGYFADRKKRQVFARPNKTPIIAIICPEVISLYYSKIITKLSDEISRMGGIMSLSISDFNGEKEKKLVKYYSNAEGIDGIILISGIKQEFDFELAVPIVSISEYKNDTIYDCVSVNIKMGISEAINYLKNLGHSKIGFIGENLTEQKLLYFKNAITENGLDMKETYIKVSEKRFEEAGYLSMKKILEEAEKPTAIITAYDEIAFGAIHAMNDQGFKTPQDISVIGINDIGLSSYLDTPLTTIKTHMDELCEISLNLLKRKIYDKKYTTVQHIDVKSELIIRKTTCEIKESHYD